MHPTREELLQFANQELTDPTRQKEIADHVKACEFCSEFCENYRQLMEPPEPLADEPLPEKLRKLADELHEAALRSATIDLKPLTGRVAAPEVSYLAADSAPEEQPGVRNIATLCSEFPEVVLRVMRDSREDRDYLQLLARDPRLAAHVMVRVPQLNREFVTDADGRAEIDLQRAENLEALKWQIKMPDAVFALEPLKYDPDKIEYAKEITLETDRHDRVNVRFEGKTEGKQLSIKVIELGGKTDFGPVRVSITQESQSGLLSAEPGKPVRFGPIDSDTTMNMRLYQ